MFAPQCTKGDGEIRRDRYSRHCPWYATLVLSCIAYCLSFCLSSRPSFWRFLTLCLCSKGQGNISPSDAFVITRKRVFALLMGFTWWWLTARAPATMDGSAFVLTFIPLTYRNMSTVSNCETLCTVVMLIPLLSSAVCRGQMPQSVLIAAKVLCVCCRRPSRNE